jgi:hypothetical protein
LQGFLEGDPLLDLVRKMDGQSCFFLGFGGLQRE